MQIKFIIPNLTAMVDLEKNPLVHERLKLFGLDDRHLERKQGGKSGTKVNIQLPFQSYILLYRGHQLIQFEQGRVSLITS